MILEALAAISTMCMKLILLSYTETISLSSLLVVLNAVENPGTGRLTFLACLNILRT